MTIIIGVVRTSEIMKDTVKPCVKSTRSTLNIIGLAEAVARIVMTFNSEDSMTKRLAVDGSIKKKLELTDTANLIKSKMDAL
jgi:hypothetical protein